MSEVRSNDINFYFFTDNNNIITKKLLPTAPLMKNGYYRFLVKNGYRNS